MKTNRDIKLSLDVARQQSIRCMTSLLESEIEMELEKEFGQILSEETLEQIREKETQRRAKRDLALKKSRKKIFNMKKRAQLIQSIRRERSSGDLSRAKPVIKDRVPEFKKINIEY